eukprot:4717333-Amphidinium_carterae.1
MRKRSNTDNMQRCERRGVQKGGGYSAFPDVCAGQRGTAPRPPLLAFALSQQDSDMATKPSWTYHLEQSPNHRRRATRLFALALVALSAVDVSVSRGLAMKKSSSAVAHMETLLVGERRCLLVAVKDLPTQILHNRDTDDGKIASAAHLIARTWNLWLPCK